MSKKFNLSYCFLICFSFISAVGVAQQQVSAKEFQADLNEKFKNPDSSPLAQEDLADFVSLSFFEIDSTFIVKAKFVRTANDSVFAMKTTTNRLPLYAKYGELHFTYEKVPYKLNVYQNQRLKSDPEYKNYFFIPFTDLSNGKETYAGGRYLDIWMSSSNQSSLQLDFNKAYNPYCVYNKKYSCPIPPAENHLEFSVLAGVKMYNKDQ
ncbi:DUF1684 domain-containing protein [Mesonia sp. HuA40]|uniref:DUF1684 domain-containing protein n=1 Tax=Mesonia sp. HuA40 TaxID=2602761 RepID=UPI0011C6F58B|nr:DUF1684 domain-containing protein [Mesonia sp. HuA40]TXK73588.1 DUF1684 domain-containing protein [Mesonia sp. HuA40]